MKNCSWAIATILFALAALPSCGGQSSTQPAADPGRTDEATRPVRVATEETPNGPVRIGPPAEAPLPPSEVALTSGETVDPPPVEPP